MSAELSRRRFLAGSTAGAAAVAAGVPAAAGQTDDEMDGSSGDLEDLEAFVDEQMAEAVGEDGADGATVSVVRGDETLLAKGYGHAYMSPDEPVRPDETLFRIGSTSKAITWAAAMQLVDEGEVDPETDVNEYLTSVSVSDRYDDPVTLSHLGTHTAGFEARARGDVAEAVEHVRLLPKSLGTNPPTRVRPPGELGLYTNYAAALTGQLVGDVEGTTFGEAVNRTLLTPLGMEASTFEPAPDALVPGRDSYTDDLNWYSDVAPASGMHATATEMARYLRMHLNGGVVEGERVLSAAAVERMHEQWFTPHERLDGVTFGLFEETRDDVRVLSHSGGVMDFHTDLFFVPALGLGAFVSYHVDDGEPSLSELKEAFLDRFVPAGSSGSSPDPDGPPAEADTLTGTYRSAYSADSTTYRKLLWNQMLGSDTVSMADDGALLTGSGESRTRWVEVEPRVFRRADGSEMLTFQTADDGTTHLIRERNVLIPFERVRPHERAALHARLAAVTAVVMLTAVVGWPLAAGVRWFRGHGSLPPGVKRARWVAGGAAGWPLLMGLVAVGGILLGELLAGPPIWQRTPQGLWLVFLVPVAGALATGWAAVHAGRAWRDGAWSLLARIHYSAVVVASAVLLWLAHYWNLMGLVT